MRRLDRSYPRVGGRCLRSGSCGPLFGDDRPLLTSVPGPPHGLVADAVSDETIQVRAVSAGLLLSGRPMR